MIAVILALALVGMEAKEAVACPGGQQEGWEYIHEQLGEESAARRPPAGRIAQEYLGRKEVWLRACPNNEYVWYTVLRASELTSADGRAGQDLLSAARKAVPDSPWIETVYARSIGTVQAARAVALRWPRHRPAQVVLAAAYERSGDLKAALAVLEPLLQDESLEQIVGGGVLLARVALALGDARRAFRAARMEACGLYQPIEPVAGMLRVEEAFELDERARELASKQARGITKAAEQIRPLQCPSPNGLSFSHLYLGENSLMEPQRPGVRAELFFGAFKTWWLHDCPHNEIVWYTVVRAAELLAPDGRAPIELIDAASRAAPKSVLVETVRARALATVEAARSALRLGPNHEPAKIALAAAYEREGNLNAAMEILRAIPSLEKHVGAPLLMARIALALGDLRLAAQTASRETDDPSSHSEPVSSMHKAKEGALFAGDAWMRLHESEKALTSYLRAYSLADSRLLGPSEDLLRSMERRFTARGISRDPRERLRGYLGVRRLHDGKVVAGVRMLVASAAHLGPGFATDALKGRDAVVTSALRKLRSDGRLSARERQVIDSVLAQESPPALDGRSFETPKQPNLLPP